MYNGSLIIKRGGGANTKDRLPRCATRVIFTMLGRTNEGARKEHHRDSTCETRNLLTLASLFC